MVALLWAYAEAFSFFDLHGNTFARLLLNG